jgi:mannitol 2-dehydrogenase
VDRHAQRLRADPSRLGEDPLASTADRDIVGDLVDDERFVAPH